MGVLRLVTVILIALWPEVVLQQPPRDGRPLLQSAEQLVGQAHEHYKRQEWPQAVDKYEAALAQKPELVSAYFFLANSYDSLYKPSRSAQPGNDTYIHKAVRNYRIAAERDTDGTMRRRAMEYLVAAYGPEKLNDPAEAEPILLQMIDMDPSQLATYVALAKVYEDGGEYEAAEEILIKAKELKPRDPGVYTTISAFYNRQGDFAKTMEALHQAADLEPNNPAAHQRVAVFYWEKAFRDLRLTTQQKRGFLTAGVAATDRALALDPDYAEALTYKNILLRLQANEETDSVLRAQLIAEADALRARAMHLNRVRSGGRQSR